MLISICLIFAAQFKLVRVIYLILRLLLVKPLNNEKLTDHRLIILF
jgi:hypothetical protein